MMTDGNQDHAICAAHLDPAYTGFFACFNRGEYFEAHDVLEALWLRVRAEPVGNFYKGLIQVAGAFVHLQKGRLGPAVSLFRLADGYLARYPAAFEGLDVGETRRLIQHWKAGVECGEGNPLARWPRPQISLMN